MENETLDFQTLYTTFQPRILRYLTGLVGEYEAEDLTQEVFVRVNQALPTFRGESRPSTWIYRIATNAAFDRRRQASFQREAPLGQEVDEDSGQEWEDQNVWTSEPVKSLEQSLQSKQRLNCFCEFIKMLPENYRLVVALNQLEDFTAKEIADIMGLSVDVVKIRLHRGRTRLLEQLKTHCKPEDWL